MLKPTQPTNHSHRESTATSNQFMQHSTNHLTANANNNHSGNPNPQYSNNGLNNGLANGRVSNVSFASYEKIGSIEKVVDENQTLLADKATPLKTSFVDSTSFQPTTIEQTNHPEVMVKPQILLKSPIHPLNNDVGSDQINLSLLNGMFSSMGNHQRSNASITDTVPMRQLVVDDKPIETLAYNNGTERVNDIYVNRNVGALYNSTSRDAYATKPASKTILLYDDPFSGAGYKGFYLHGSRVENRLISELSDTKVYNAFSRKLRPDASGTKLSQPPVRNWDSFGKPETVAFEDDELTNILG